MDYLYSERRVSHPALVNAHQPSFDVEDVLESIRAPEYGRIVRVPVYVLFVRPPGRYIVSNTLERQKARRPVHYQGTFR